MSLKPKKREFKSEFVNQKKKCVFFENKENEKNQLHRLVSY